MASAPNTTCWLRNGTYHEQVLISSKTGFTLAAYEGETATLDGTIPIEGGWVERESGIWESVEPQSIWQLFVGYGGDAEQTLARFPNALAWTDDVWQHHSASAGWRVQSSSASMYHMVDDGDEGDSTALADAGVSFDGCPTVLNTGHWQTVTSTVRNHTVGTGEFDYSEDTEFSFVCCDGHGRYYIEGDACHLATANCGRCYSSTHWTSDRHRLFCLIPPP